MSKSKKNVIDPELIINNYGADSVRLFILSDSPPEKDVQWSEQGMVSSFKFIQKFWILHKKIKSFNKNKANKINDLELDKFTNQIIHKVNQSLERFSYNTIVSSLYEIYNFLNKITDKELGYENLINNYKKILKIMMPVTPHFTSECLTEIGNEDIYNWPKVENQLLENDINKIIIQINGKKREILSSSRSFSESELINETKKITSLQKFLIGKQIKKTIYIKDKLINFII